MIARGRHDNIAVDIHVSMMPAGLMTIVVNAWTNMAGPVRCTPGDQAAYA